MLILQAVLEEEDVARVVRGLSAASWRDGKATAGAQARTVKQNEQSDGSNAAMNALADFIEAAFARHPLFAIAARPRRFSRLLFSRYADGMAYGAHTDDALMGADFVRTDLAFTLFLADPETYDGGALIVESALGEQEIKLSAGDAILYPAGSIHRVAPVTRGVRLACVGWVQSLIADAGQRDMLFDLSVVRERLREEGAKAETLLLLDKTISNLLRAWARP